MWVCFDCDRHFKGPDIGITCPYCRSEDIAEIEKGSSLEKNGLAANRCEHPHCRLSQKPYSYQEPFTVLDDSFIVGNLMRCGVDNPTIFSLVWGHRMACEEGFPLELRKIVIDIIQEEEKKREFQDPLERKLHNIIIDLLQVMYEKQVNNLVKSIIEMKKYMKNRRE